MSFHFVGSSVPFDGSQSLLLPFVAVEVDLAGSASVLPRRNILPVLGAGPRAKADANDVLWKPAPLRICLPRAVDEPNKRRAEPIPPQSPPDISRKMGRRMDGEWY